VFRFVKDVQWGNVKSVKNLIVVRPSGTDQTEVHKIRKNVKSGCVKL